MVQASSDRTSSSPTPSPTSSDHQAALIDVSVVAALLSCSCRHVWRLRDCGKIPKALRLGALVRWRKSDIDSWIAAGCPAQR